MRSKKLIKDHQQALISKTIQNEVNEFHHLLQAPAAKEILTAFFEKRQPNIKAFKATP